MEKRLYRSRSDRMVWGVCGGLAKYFEIDPVIIRLVAVLSIFISGLGILAYIILAIVVPLESSAATEPKDIMKENVQEMKETATQLGQELRSTFGSKEASGEVAKERHRARNILGIILIVLGVIFLLANFGFPWLRYLWPLVVIAIGALIIFSSRRK